VQRSVTVLNEKDVDYEVSYIDLRNKPDWFLQISPTGKVPVLQVDADNVLFESAVINEFLDESHAPHYMPETPLARAYERMWSDFVAGLYGLVGRPFSAPDEETAREALAALQDRLVRLEEQVDGPLFNGEQFGLVDATAAPPFMRLQWAEEVEPSLDVFSKTPKVRAWKEALLARDSAVNSVPEEVEALYKQRITGAESWLRNGN